MINHGFISFSTDTTIILRTVLLCLLSLHVDTNSISSILWKFENCH